MVILVEKSGPITVKDMNQRENEAQCFSHELYISMGAREVREHFLHLLPLTLKLLSGDVWYVFLL